jgi:hypothetical protein
VSGNTMPMSAELTDLALTAGRSASTTGTCSPSPGGTPNLPSRFRSAARVGSAPLLARHYRDADGRPPSQAALADALVVLEGEAAPEYRPVGRRRGDRAGRVLAPGAGGRADTWAR